MQTLWVLTFAALFLALVAVASIAPRRTVLSSYELQRRRAAGDVSAAEELRRSLLINDILSLQKAVEALLLVCAVPCAIMAFGWLAGVLIAVFVALGYGRIAHNGMLAAVADRYYMMLEPKLLQFVERYPSVGKLLRSVTAPPEASLLSSRQELEHLVKESGAILTADEKRLIKSTLHFSDKTVEEVMTPRGVIDAVKKDQLIGPLLLDELHKTGHSRFPVMDGDIDHIVGVLYIRDLLTLTDKRSHRAETAMERKVYCINQNQKLEKALSAFIKTRHHLFIVVNDYRETAGVVTIEDVIEALLGRKIVDEDDVVVDLRAFAAKNPRHNNKSSAATDI